MSFALDIVTIVAVSASVFFFLAGTVGLLRFPDTLTRAAASAAAGHWVFLLKWRITRSMPFTTRATFSASTLSGVSLGR
jgi:hypothetical protein